MLNLLLLPHFGLAGAVWATAAANFIALALIFRFNAWLGMKIERSLLLVSLLPLTLGLGPFAAVATLVAVIVGIITTDRILSREEKRQLGAVFNGYLNRFRPLESPHLAKSASIASLVQPGTEIDGSEAHPVWGPELNNLHPGESTDPAQRPLRVMFIITSMHVGGAENLAFELTATN